MEPKNQDLESEVIGLPQADRARLAFKLIQSLDPGVDEDVDKLWLDEAERRLADYDAGKTQALDGGQAIEAIENRLK